MYERDAWRAAELDWVDERIDGAVELVATRMSDGATLAIEHTVIQPNPNEKEDFAKFAKAFLPGESDPSLVVPGRYTYVDVPLGTLKKGMNWKALAAEVLAFIRAKKESFPEDRFIAMCPVSSGPDVPLQVHFVPDPGEPGRTLIRRYGDFDLTGSVKKALADKLPKLTSTPATKRILMFARDQFTLPNDAISLELERLRPTFPLLSKIDEVWIVEVFDNGETICFEPARTDGKYSPTYCFAGTTLQWRHDGL